MQNINQETPTKQGKEGQRIQNREVRFSIARASASHRPSNDSTKIQRSILKRPWVGSQHPSPNAKTESSSATSSHKFGQNWSHHLVLLKAQLTSSPVPAWALKRRFWYYLKSLYGAECYTPPPPHPWKYPSRGGGRIKGGGAYKIPAAPWGLKIYNPTPLPWKMPYGQKWGGGGGNNFALDFIFFQCWFGCLSACFGVLSAGFPQKKRKYEKREKDEQKTKSKTSKFLGNALWAGP